MLLLHFVFIALTLKIISGYKPGSGILMPKQTHLCVVLKDSLSRNEDSADITSPWTLPSDGLQGRDRDTRALEEVPGGAGGCSVPCGRLAVHVIFPRTGKVWLMSLLLFLL